MKINCFNLILFCHSSNIKANKNSNSPETPSTWSISQSRVRCKQANMSNMTTPTNTVSKAAAYRDSVNSSMGFLLTPPKSVSSASTTTTWQQRANGPPQHPNTPVRPSQPQSAHFQRNRTMTPSASPPPPPHTSKLATSSSHVPRISIMTSTTKAAAAGLNAPPKPPRRSSLKINH